MTTRWRNRLMIAVFGTVSALLIAWVWAATLTNYAEFFLTSALFGFLC